MPISTLCAKSMPSTNSRKPCTKCWRDISPSQTMSMPASSCNLIASNVASSLPARARRLQPPLRPQLVRLGEPGRFRQAAGDGRRKQHASSPLHRLHRSGVRWRPANYRANRSARAVFLRPSPHREIADQGLAGRSAHRCGPACARPVGHARCAAPARALIGAQRARPDHRDICASMSASTAASSIAMPAPCARNGSIGWAASPISVTGPLAAANGVPAVVQRPFQPALGHARSGRARSRPRTSARSGAGSRRGRRRAYQPVSFHSSCTMRDDVDRACRL